MRLRLLLLCFSLLLFTSCDDKGEAYKSPKTELSAETYEAITKGDTCKYYWDTPQIIYLDIGGSIYKTIIVSESHLLKPVSVGVELVWTITWLILGMVIMWVFKD